MAKKKLSWVIYQSFLALLFFVVLGAAWYVSRTIRDDHYTRTERSLRAAASILAWQLRVKDDEPALSTVDPICKSLGRATGYRFTVVLLSGRILGDSEGNPAEMDNHADREEIAAALSDELGVSRRWSHTLNVWMMYVAVPVKHDGVVRAVVRAALPISDIDESLAAIRQRILLAGAAVAALAALVSIGVARRISRPLETLRAAAERLGDGSPRKRLPASRIVEIDALAQTMNSMLDDLRDLERMRRDFVANVSHELKTPITSIRGFTDTLLEGAAENREERERFLAIIDRQAGRLESIVEDLLTLAGIEHDTEAGASEFQDADIGNIVNSAVQACAAAADNRSARIETDCSPGLVSRVNVQLLEQAVVNLVDNAIKYSDAGTTIHVSAHQDADLIAITVKDQGHGIPRKHLSRIFERFYRVDKGRSRNLGGTGLGLAIVKHVAAAHGGRVSVESVLGEGSTFSIHIPTRKPAAT